MSAENKAMRKRMEEEKFAFTAPEIVTATNAAVL